MIFHPGWWSNVFEPDLKRPLIALKSCHTDRGIERLSTFARDHTSRALKAEVMETGGENVCVHSSKNRIRANRRENRYY